MGCVMLLPNLSPHQTLARMVAEIMFPSMRKGYRVRVKILLEPEILLP